MSDPFSEPRFGLVHLERTYLRLCLLSCPGIRFNAATPISNDGLLEEDVDRLEHHSVKMVVSCLTEAELLLGTERYRTAYAQRGILWHIVAIPDMAPPTEVDDARLTEALRLAEAFMANGHRLAVHCLAGLGRTGTVAARFAMSYGLTAPEAIDFIRNRYDRRAIETGAQEAFLFSR